MIDMIRKHYLRLPLMALTALLTTTAGLTTACGSKPPRESAKLSEAIAIHQNMPGDSARYGLACDGCTDSIIVFLPYTGGDPDTFDILQARQEHRIMGRPHIGDALSVIVSPTDSTEALSVINMSTLEGQWCYMVTPTLRTIDGKQPPIPDSLRRKILVPVEYSLRLKSDNSAMAMGAVRHNMRQQSPADYPDITHYTEWRLYNGRLILHADTIAGFSAEGDKPVTDTADIVLLRRDSLVLRFGDKTQGFYRRKAEVTKR